MKQKYLHLFLPIERRLSTYLFLKFCCHQFLNHIPSNHPAKPLATAHESVYSHTSGSFSCQQKWTTRCMVQSFAHFVCPFGSLSLGPCLQGCPREGLPCCGCPLWVVTCMLCRATHKPGPSSSLPLTANGREFPMWYRLGEKAV